jgi:ketosteroid isomerase-like protein
MEKVGGTAEDHESLRAWVDEFSGHVEACEFDDAAKQFDDDVVSFSSFKDVVVGIDQFVDEQWRRVWPSMTDFRFESEAMRTLVSPDRLMATVIVTWSSIGYNEDGTPFDRPGRCTVVLRREAVGAPWYGVHGHFSLKRGVPQQSFGRREPA